MTPTVTVLIPAFDAGRFVGEMMDSVLSTVGPSVEILVIDDGSTDDTAAVLASYDDRRIRVLHQDNRGLVATLNRGLDEARGEFVARLDADDWMVRGRIEAQLAAMAADPRLVSVGTDYVLVFPDGTESARIRMPATDAACRERLSLASCHCGPSVLLRMAPIRRAGLYFDESARHAEDYEMWTRLTEVGTLANLPVRGYRYRIHDDQVSTVHSAAQRKVHLAVAERYARARGHDPVPERKLEELLWPEGPRATRTLRASRAALAVLRRQRGTESVRFVGRKVVEAAARR